MKYLIILIVILFCYYINRLIIKRNLKRGNTYTWETVITNIIASVFILPSVFFWIAFVLYKLPNIPEVPPKWL